jgi:transcriptional regulator MraZ
VFQISPPKGCRRAKLMNFESTTATNEDRLSTFHGSHTRKVDAKGRFHLPFQFRGDKIEIEAETGESREKYMISPGPDGSAALSPYLSWLERFNARAEGQSKQDQIRNQRIMSLNSFMLVPDKQGRVALPPKVKETLGVDKEVLIVGMGLHMELWSPDKVVGGQVGTQAPSDDYLYDFFG